MIGLDTNVLVRYLVQDDPAQGRLATKVIATASRAGERLFLSTIVLCELVWVLESAYKYPKDTIDGTLEKILLTAQFEVEDKDAAWLALADYRASGIDFADALIGRRNLRSGCDATLTFDRSLKALDAFRVIS
jgi:predicted nucleic-acid-binding protein